eukprot:sb/3474258/
MNIMVTILLVGTAGALQCYGGQSWSGPLDTPEEIGPCTEYQGCAKRKNWQCGPCLDWYLNCTNCFEPLCNGGTPSNTTTTVPDPQETGDKTAQINSNGTKTNGTDSNETSTIETSTSGGVGTGQLLIEWAVVIVITNLFL